MDVDSDIKPLLDSMSEAMQRIRLELLPALKELDEDTLASQYSVDEQARLYISAAFTLALSLYSLDKLTHRLAPPPRGDTRHRGGPRLDGSSPAATTTDGAPVASSTDAQLVLKIERVTKYIKKLKELTLLEQEKDRESVLVQAEALEQPREGPGKKRARATDTPCGGNGKAAATPPEPRGSLADGHPATDSNGKEENDLGDQQMFDVVARVPGEAGVLVSRLLKQVMSEK